MHLLRSAAAGVCDLYTYSISWLILPLADASALYLYLHLACRSGSGRALLFLAAGSTAFVPLTPSGLSHTRHALCAATKSPRRASAALGGLSGLRAQLGDMPKADAADSGQKLPEITEEMMMMMALEKRKASGSTNLPRQYVHADTTFVPNLPASSDSVSYICMHECTRAHVCPHTFGTRAERQKKQDSR